MPLSKYGGTSKWVSVGARIPPEDFKRLEDRYPERGQISEVLRALIQMHLDNTLPFTLQFKQEIKN